MQYEDVDPEIAALLFEIKKNQLRMVHRRGYSIEREKSILEMTLPQFLSIYIPFAQQQGKSFRAVLTNLYENAEGRKLLAYYADVPAKSTQMGKEEAAAAIASMDKYKVRDAFIITPKQLSSSASNHINNLPANNIQIFLEEEMAYDPTQHFLVPKHTPLTIEEQRAFLENNNISIDQMPVILSSDIIIRNLGVRSGRIVKIERENMYETMIIKSLTYKVVKDN